MKLLSILVICFVNIYNLKTDKIEEKFTGNCTIYKDHAPDGYCHDLLANQSVAQDPKNLVRTHQGILAVMKNIELLVASNKPDIAQNMLEAGKNLMFNNMLKDCPGQDKIKPIINSIKLPKIKNVHGCIIKLKWLLCHSAHPICTNKHELGKRLPCREHCEKALKLDVCKELLESLIELFKINKYCPRYFRSGNYFNCSFYPERDPNNEDSCHWNKDFLEETDTNENKKVDIKKNKDDNDEDLLIFTIGIPSLLVLLLLIGMTGFFYLRKYLKKVSLKRFIDRPIEYQTDGITPNSPNFKEYVVYNKKDQM